MKIVFIEPTPSPNTMKLHLDESLEPGIRKTYTPDNERSAPAWIRNLLGIPGVKSVFHTLDFVALDRKGSADWAAILSEVQKQFGQEGVESAWSPESDEAATYGEAQVFVQFFRGIPMQIRVKAGSKEERISLSERFVNAVTEVASATLIKERKLTDYGVRYGGSRRSPARSSRSWKRRTRPSGLRGSSPRRSPTAAARPSSSSSGASRAWTRSASGSRTATGASATPRSRRCSSRAPKLCRCWPKRCATRRCRLRRLAVVYLGDVRTPEAMELLYEALRDSSAAVRRTAGDTLSDIGDPAATGPMIAALRDSSKLVRWRAARFLYEVGTDDALEALRAAADDPEFEVGLQARMAVERIESGEQAAGTVWQQMANRDRGEARN